MQKMQKMQILKNGADPTKIPKNRTCWVNFLHIKTNFGSIFSTHRHYLSKKITLTYFFLGEKMQFFYDKNNEISRPALLASFSKTASANNPSPLVSYEVAGTAKTQDRLTFFFKTKTIYENVESR